MNRPRWLPDAALAAAVFLVNVGLNTPLFLPGDSPYRESIESGYASMARFISAHPNPWGWNPTQYCGLPTQFLYVPGLPYAAALGTWITQAPPEYAYRLIAAVLACLGPATMFLLARFFTGSRGWGLAAALAYTFFSPLYGLVEQIGNDRSNIAQLPWRMQVLVKYGEGPHNAGLTLIPLALIAVWKAGVQRRYGDLLAAALLMAAVTLFNWMAALALALCCLMLMAVALPTEKRFSAAWVFGAAALAYLLACFWLTPTFIQTVLFNWPKDSYGYRAGLMQTLSAAGAAACGFLLWLALMRMRRGFYFTFVNLAAFVFGWLIFGYYRYGIDLIPESRRYAVEFELFLMLAAVEWIRMIWDWKRPAALAVALAMALPGLPQAWKYITQSPARRAPWPLEETVEYAIARWLAQQNITGRVFATGGLRFRLNAWFEVPQVGGGFESGLTNRRPVDLAYQVRTGSADSGRGIQDQLTQLKALGVQYIAVHGPLSREYYRDFKNPHQFEGVLPAAFHVEDDTIYALPSSGLAHLVRPAELAGYHKPPHLDAYAAALDDTARPQLKSAWHGPGEMTLEGPAPQGMIVSVQVNYDPGWAAYQNGHAVPIDKDALGFLVLRPRPAAQTHIDLRYEGTGEQRLMAGISVLAWLAAIAGMGFGRRYGRVEITQ